MVIEKITYGKKTTLLVANDVEYVVDPDCILTFRLSAGSEIDDNTFYEFLKENDFVLCKKYLFDQIGRYLKTEKGYENKLREKGFRANSIRLAIARAKELGYVDDVKYCEIYYERYKNKKGVRKIYNELRSKGVDKEILSFLNEREENLDSVRLMGEKFMKKREYTLDNKVKLMRHLASKGFSYDTVTKVTRDIFNDVD